jgi:hypothetical protein
LRDKGREHLELSFDPYELCFLFPTTRICGIHTVGTRGGPEATTTTLEEADMAKGKGKGKPFGGFSISFKGASDSLEAVFGGSPIGPAEMTKKLWAYVKRKKLAGKR